MPPPLVAELIWSQDLSFGATAGANAIVVDGDSAAGMSPPQLLAVALAGCMSIDIVDIVQKGRHRLAAFRATLSGERAPDAPRRFVRIGLVFHVHGDVPAATVERAMALSREKYCSVWHSMREDIELTTTYEIVPGTPAS